MTLEVGNTMLSCASDQMNCQSNTGNVTESYKVDMLRMQLACLTPSDSANEDGSSDLVNNVPDATRPQEFNSVSELATLLESTEGDFDSTDSLRLPSPPADSPDLVAKANDCGRDSAVSTDVVDSISSRASLDSLYVWSSANSDLPSWSLPEDKERFIWPSKVEAFFEALICNQML